MDHRDCKEFHGLRLYHNLYQPSMFLLQLFIRYEFDGHEMHKYNQHIQIINMFNSWLHTWSAFIIDTRGARLSSFAIRGSVSPVKPAEILCGVGHRIVVVDYGKGRNRQQYESLILTARRRRRHRRSPPPWARSRSSWISISIHWIGILIVGRPPLFVQCLLDDNIIMKIWSMERVTTLCMVEYRISSLCPAKWKSKAEVLEQPPRDGHCFGEFHSYMQYENIVAK